MLQGVPVGCTDYSCTEDAGLVVSDKQEEWRLAGDTKVDYGFELTQDKDNQQVQ